MPRASTSPAEPDEHWAALIERTAERDETALSALYDGTAALVNGLALRILQDAGVAEEVTIDVYLQLWRHAARYDGTRGAPLAWLLTLARSRAIDRLRAGATRRQRTAPLRKGLRIAEPAPGPEECSAATERRHLVTRALAALAGDQRRVVELAYYGGLSHSEIAAALNEPLGTVKTRLRLGMTHLRRTLGGRGRAAL